MDIANRSFSNLTSTRITAALLLASLMLSLLPLQSASAQVADTSSVRIPQTFRFNANLRFGQTLSPDVMYLQRFLNSNPTTQIGSTGAGSNSQLTNYFGQRTKDAVMRFQTLYRDEVLAPAGLTAPSGIVGEFSRRKINALLAQPNANQQAPIQQAQIPQNAPAAPYAALQNHTSIPLTQAQVSSYQNLFPQSTAVPQWWEQVLADTRGGQEIIDYTPQVLDPQDISQTVASSTAAGRKPVITGISPRIIGSEDQVITIHGRDFDSEGVTLFSNIGIAGTVPQPETLLGGPPVLRFRLKDFDDFGRAKIYFSSTTQDIFFQVVNEELASDSAAIATFAFPRYTGAASSSVPTATTTSNTSASQASSLSGGLMALGAVVGIGLLANSLASSFGSGVAAGAAGAIDPMSLLNRPFGGKILFIHPCLDSANFLVYILKAGTIPRPIRLVYVPILSRLHQYFILRPGANVIGTYRIGGWCTSGGGFVGGRIRQIGTSF